MKSFIVDFCLHQTAQRSGATSSQMTQLAPAPAPPLLPLFLFLLFPACSSSPRHRPRAAPYFPAMMVAESEDSRRLLYI